MQTKRLGRTDVDLSIVGVGTAFLGIAEVNDAAQAYAALNQPFVLPIDRELGVQALIAAIEAGCTLIDTAPLYLSTIAEQMIGEALRSRPDLRQRVTVTTKVGQLYGSVDHSRDAVLRHVEGSLQRLGLDCFDVLYIHDPMGLPMGQVMGRNGTLGALRQLQKDGVVKWLGTAANEPAVNADYIETGEFDAAVIPECWSLLNQRACERILPAAVQHNVGLVGATPLERGLLATGPVPGIDYLARDFTQPVLDHVARIEALCATYGVALNAVALQWCTRHPQVTATIPGARTPAEARANGVAGSVLIPEALWTDLAPLVQHWQVSQV
jgi:D-threo-aldose 1-dehydrogenase